MSHSHSEFQAMKLALCMVCGKTTVHERQRNSNLWVCQEPGCGAVNPAKFCNGCQTCTRPC